LNVIFQMLTLTSLFAYLHKINLITGSTKISAWMTNRTLEHKIRTIFDPAYDPTKENSD